MATKVLKISSQASTERQKHVPRVSKFENKFSKDDSKDEMKRKRDYSIQPGFGNAKWHRTMQKLYDLVRTEPPVDDKGQPIHFKPVKYEMTLDHIAEKFINYVLVFQKLSDCLPRLIHPQKRKLLKKCIETCATRVCELKHQMIAWNRCLFHYFDDLLRDKGLTPENLELKVPTYMLRDRQKVLSMRQNLLAWMIQRLATLTEPKVEDLINPFTDNSNKESLAKLAQGKTQDVDKDSMINTYSSDDFNRYVPDFHCQNVMRKLSRDDDEMAKLVRLQSYCRSWLARSKMRKLREEEFVSLGMSFPRDALREIDDDELTEFDIQEKKYVDREDDMINKKHLEYEHLIENKGLDMAWELKLNLTQWLLEMSELQGELPDYPEEDEGGFDAIFRNKTLEEVEEELEEMFDPMAKQEHAPKKEPPAKPKNPEPEESGWKMPPSQNIVKLIGLLNEYNSYWYFKFEKDNPLQIFDKQLIMEEVRSEAGKIIRQQVDKLMRYELENFKLAIENKIYKSEKDKKQADPKRTPQVKMDATGDKSVEELYGELVLMGLVKPVNNIKFSDLIGDQNFQKDAQRECIPTIPDIKNLMTLLLAIPLNSEVVHSALPLINTMLFAGPPGTGKTMLLHAICRETGSNLIDLSPLTLSGKYVGTEEQNYLKAVLLKVGKAMEPTIFYVDECELLFLMKTPPKEEENPGRWVSFLQTLMNKFKPGDRMALIGITHLPFYCKSKSMVNLFKNVIFFPLPEYGSRRVMWLTILNKLNLRASALNVSILSKLTDGYSFREIQFVIDNVLHADRLSRCRPVTNEEFLQCLTLMSRPSPELKQAWLDWYAQLPMVIAYKNWQKDIDELEESAGQAD